MREFLAMALAFALLALSGTLGDDDTARLPVAPAHGVTEF